MSVWDKKGGTVPAISVLDTTSNKVIATIPVQTRPFLSAVSPDGKLLYVPNHDTNTVSVIDTATNKLVTNFHVPPNPHWVAFTPRREEDLHRQPRLQCRLGHRPRHEQGPPDDPDAGEPAQHRRAPDPTAAHRRQLHGQRGGRDRHEHRQGDQDHPGGSGTRSSPPGRPTAVSPTSSTTATTTSPSSTPTTLTVDRDRHPHGRRRPPPWRSRRTAAGATSATSTTERSPC